MQKKPPVNSAFIITRTLVILLSCAAACLIVTRTLPAFLRSDSQANVSPRTLSFAERVAYLEVIEDVYWRHRIWPKERPDPKPSLDAVMSQAQLEKKVADYLRKSQALEDYCNDRLLPSSYKPKWVAWHSTRDSPKYCANSLKRLEIIPLLSLNAPPDRH